MHNDTDPLAEFLRQAGWADARQHPLAADASQRRYTRLTRADGDTAIVMQSGPDGGDAQHAFIRVAAHLRSLSLSAPEILAQDTALGLLLLEDFGDALFASVMARNPALQHSLYTAATDLLIELHRHPAPADLPVYDPAALTAMTAPLFEWYVPAASAADTPQGVMPEAFHTTLLDLCNRHAAETPVLALRDYHVLNLIWLPERAGVRQVGLLDFQDALASHPAYDLASLLRDARRDVPAALYAEMMQHYISATGVDDTAFRAAAALLGVQRNLRILGIFARLCLQDGKSGYIDMIPRVWGHLRADLAHPALAPLSALVDTLVPEPTHRVRKAIKDQCKIIQTPQ